MITERMRMAQNGSRFEIAVLSKRAFRHSTDGHQRTYIAPMPRPMAMTNRFTERASTRITPVEGEAGAENLKVEESTEAALGRSCQVFPATHRGRRRPARNGKEGQRGRRSPTK